MFILLVLVDIVSVSRLFCRHPSDNDWDDSANAEETATVDYLLQMTELAAATFYTL